MIIFPNAKINIGLRVLRKRNDGFHDLESVFYPLQLSDILEIVPLPDLNDKDSEISVTGLPLPSSTDNLCMKAVNMVRDRYGIPPVRLHLHKIIPVGSGLGGGSSDAAHTLQALNNLFNIGVGNDELKALAAEIGSDCPFFLENQPCLASGRGEILKPLKIKLKGYYLALILPAINISTAMAYSLVIPEQHGFSLYDIGGLETGDWEGLVQNSFEREIFKQYPELESIKKGLYASGAVYASMSGSGSAVYGIFSKEPVLDSKLQKHSIYIESLI